MMTKKELCRAIIEEFELHEGRTPVPADVFKSSKLAVAMDYLKKLPKIESDYAKGRGGVVFSFFNRKEGVVKFLTVRELLAMLPE